MTEKLSIGEKFAVAPAVKKELAEVLLLAPTNLSEKLSTLMANLLKTGGVIALGERGSARIEANEDVDGIKAFDDAIKVAMKDNDKLGYADAVEKVAEEQPQLFAEYRKATYAFREA